MKKLYLMRHGQTLFNQKDIVQGWCDSPLTDLGKKQAAAAGQFLADKNITFDHVYTSDLNRTKETLDQFYTGPSTAKKELRERSYGILEGDSNSTGIFVLDHPEMYRIFQVEENDSLLKRMNGCLKEIMGQEDHENVLAVIHGDCLINFARNADPEAMEGVNRFANCIIYEFDYDEEAGRFFLADIHDEFVQNL